MCDPVSASIVAATAVTSYVVQSNAAKKAAAQANDAQNKAIALQEQRSKEAQAKQDAIGTSAKTFDFTKDAETIDAEKRNKIAMQAGMMSTMKQAPLQAAADASSTQTLKPTLGS